MIGANRAAHHAAEVVLAAAVHQAAAAAAAMAGEFLVDASGRLGHMIIVLALNFAQPKAGGGRRGFAFACGRSIAVNWRRRHKAAVRRSSLLRDGGEAVRRRLAVASSGEWRRSLLLLQLLVVRIVRRHRVLRKCRRRRARRSCRRPTAARHRVAAARHRVAADSLLLLRLKLLRRLALIGGRHAAISGSGGRVAGARHLNWRPVGGELLNARRAVVVAGRAERRRRGVGPEVAAIVVVGGRRWRRRVGSDGVAAD